MRKAPFTGITGQDGSYLADFLLAKGYEFHGIIRRSSSFNTLRINQIYEVPHSNNNKPHLFLHYDDLSSSERLIHMIVEIQPDEIYYLAAQSHVGVFVEMSEYITDIDAMGVLRILDIIRKSCKLAKFYQA